MADAHPFAESVTHLLASLIRSALPNDEASAGRARQDALRLHETVRAEAVGQDLGSLKLDGLWTGAVKEAETPDLDGIPLRVSQSLPANCPLTLGDLVQPGLAVSDLEDRIRLSAATG